ncbi:MAG: ATP-binding protein [Balneolaceae bacterium]
MDSLAEKFKRRLNNISLGFVRSMMYEINWEARLIGIRGARGVGKTTLLLQYIKKNLAMDHSVLYVSLDNIWFSENRLSVLADQFVKQGGKYLFLDEVHKYPDWSVELKNIYDDYPDLQIVFTGSSLLELLQARADLSRRAVVYSMQGLSFREYLNFEANHSFDSVTLESILDDHTELTQEIVSECKPLEYFHRYLKTGYYPFYKEVPDLYYSRIEEVLNLIFEIELTQLRGVEMAYVPKLKQLLLVIAESAPFIPNISRLSKRIGINRVTLLTYLRYLEDAGVIHSLFKDAKGISRLQKPDKIFLENTNISYAISYGDHQVNRGNLRETFFVNQLSQSHRITFHKKMDLLINDSILFEVGGKNKENTTEMTGENYPIYFALDDIEYGHRNQIPLWLFGFLY